MRAESRSMRSMGLVTIYLLLLVFGMTFLSGCGTSSSTAGTVNKVQDPSKDDQNTSQPVQGELPATANVSIGDLDAAITANKGWQLVDVREAREFATGHIKMALSRPMGDLENNLGQISKDKDIVLIDLNGTRSESAWRVLVENGYDQNKVKVLTGGMLQWRGIISEAGSNSNSTTNGSDSAATSKPEVQEMVGGC
ncbi:MAG TPA: rhodanese-like domain-containing protein [Desulfosporosinus sp.]|nr:rhodanese-like domain-containing protein [Desulfosporosinus sp.]